MLLASTPTEAAEFWLTLTQIAVSLGAVAAVAAAGRYAWNRWRWRVFKRAARRWYGYVEDAEIDDPRRIDEEVWRALIERMLTDSYFSPFEIRQLMPVAESTAKGEVGSKIYWE